MRWQDLHWFFPCTILNRRVHRLPLLVVLFQELSCQLTMDNPWISSWSLIRSTFLSNLTIVLLFLVADFWLNVNSPHNRVSKMNCGLSDNHRHSQHQRIHIEVFHLVFWLAFWVVVANSTSHSRDVERKHEICGSCWATSSRCWRWYKNLMRQIPLHILSKTQTPVRSCSSEFPRTFVHLCNC